MSDCANMHFETKAIHAGQEPDPTTGAVVTPIYQVSTFRLPDPAAKGAYFYSRLNNPTVVALEQVMAALEGGQHALAFGSGMAAISAVLALLQSGDHLLVTRDVYGGTFKLLNEHLTRQDIVCDFVDMSDAAVVEAALRPNTRLLWIETPSNPLLKVIDIAQMAGVAHRRGAMLGVDNTFASPYFQNPLALGADVVMHSCTKYLGGHSDLVAGMLIMNDEWREPLFRARQNMGGILGPFDAWLIQRAIKTLAVRMEAHQRNAFAVARFLEAHPRVARVLYPGLESHPQHALAARQMRGFSGMAAVELHGGRDAALRFVRALRLFISAVSLGGVESLAEIPFEMTHDSLQDTALSISPAMIRLSIGLEHPDDLLADLAQALAAV